MTFLMSFIHEILDFSLFFNNYLAKQFEHLLLEEWLVVGEY